MDEDAVIEVDSVSKKFCKDPKRSMFYGMNDIGRNILGVCAESDKLREGEFWAVDDVSFTLRKGECLGIIGRNGSGKSTLLKMLSGIIMPDKGQIKIRGRVGALIEVGAGFHPMLTGRENIYVNAAILGMTKKEVDEKLDDIIKFADIGDFIDTPVKYYSSGMYVRLGFAIAIHCKPDILLVDEILAVGDEGFQVKCFNKIGELKKNGTTVIIVSHNMHTISTFVNKVLLLDKGHARHFDDVAEGTKEYLKMFLNTDSISIEKICSGNENINFNEQGIDRILSPGDSFSISLEYVSLVDYEDIEIDTVIMCSNERDLYFQANNKAYGQHINLNKGTHKINIIIKDIRINNAIATLSIALWAKSRSELLFWWRVPVEFKAINYCTGKNYLNVLYRLD